MAEAATMSVTATTTQNMLRQLAVLIGIAASVAVGVAVVLWSQTPTYGLLYGSLSDRDVSAVMDALQSAGIEYKMDNASGAVMVPNSRIHEARMKLAGAGLPRGGNVGFEMLEEDQGFGTSLSLEKARLHRATEGELARSISQLSSVSSARVHIAQPNQSVFVRDKQPPSASVLVELFPGRTLEDGQVKAITHLVAASVPALSSQDVTVVDQRGNLLTHGQGDDNLMLAAKQLDHTRAIEKDLVERIHTILGPLVGHDRIRAEVSAEIDFTATESTSQLHNPDLAAKLSEQHVEETQTGNAAPLGVPGALTNQPPGGATAPETLAEGGAESEAAETAAAPQSQRRQEIVNYLPDQTISHTKPAVGTVQRLSVAVVVDTKTGVGQDGQPAKVPPSETELATYTALVKQAVGFKELRGDTVHVTSMDFTVPEPPAPLPEPPLWQQPWIWDIAKQAAGGIFVLVLLFGVLRPFMRQMMSKVTVPVSVPALEGPGGPVPAGTNEAAGGGAATTAAAAKPVEPRKLAGALSDNADLETIKGFVNEDPKLAAQVVKTWVGDD